MAFASVLRLNRVPALRALTPLRLRSTCFSAQQQNSSLVSSLTSLRALSASEFSQYEKNHQRRSYSVTNDPLSSDGARKRFAVIGLASLGLVSAILLAGYFYYKKLREKPVSQTSIGKPELGGPFVLVDHFGKPVTELDFKGKYKLIYFGFTFCPDVCPTELRKMAKVMDELEKQGLAEHVQPLFISVDPWRDTIEQIRKYLGEFHPSFLGLTGTPEQVMKACKSYRVYSSKSFTEVEEEEEDYLVEHTIFLYLMDPNNEFTDYYGQNKPAEDVFQSVSKHVGETFNKKKSWW